MLKYKQKSEDFIVEELAHFNLVKNGDYKLYLFEKKNIETLFYLRKLSNKLNIKYSDIGIAGIKDKYALTLQYITVPRNISLESIKEEGVKFKLKGYVSDKIKLGDLDGNSFIITLRNATKKDYLFLLKNKSRVILDGVPNYFDSQRFGSVIDKEFIMKHILKKDYEKAVKFYLTKSSPYESASISFEKNHIRKNWENLEKTNVKTKNLQSIINVYKKTKSWIESYKAIPRELREIYVSAYQSYLWNECIKKLISENSNKVNLKSINYAVDSLYFPLKKINLPENFPTISEKMEINISEKNIIDYVLKKEKIKLSDFSIKKETENYFISNKRDTILHPQKFKLFPLFEDYVNSSKREKKYCIKMSFQINKGSYATIITKSLVGN